MAQLSLPNQLALTLLGLGHSNHPVVQNVPKNWLKDKFVPNMLVKGCIFPVGHLLYQYRDHLCIGWYVTMMHLHQMWSYFFGTIIHMCRECTENCWAKADLCETHCPVQAMDTSGSRTLLEICSWKLDDCSIRINTCLHEHVWCKSVLCQNFQVHIWCKWMIAAKIWCIFSTNGW